MGKFKDNNGHTILLNSDADSIKAECPYCKQVKDCKQVKVFNRVLLGINAEGLS